MEIGKDLAKNLLDMLMGTRDFVLEQAPDVARQLVAFQTAKAAIWAGLWTLISLLVIYPIVRIGKSVIKEVGDPKSHDSGAILVVYLIGIAISLGLPGSAALSYWEDFAKVVLAPKVFLIEYLSALIK